MIECLVGQSFDTTAAATFACDVAAAVIFNAVATAIGN
jgi:hypothetical protein